jgi:DNA processing protein
MTAGAEVHDHELHDDETAGAVAALAKLPGVGSARLRAFLDHHTPVDALERLARGRPLDGAVVHAIPSGQLAEMRRAAAASSPADEQRRLADAGVSVTWRSRSDYPSPLRYDPDAPAALFTIGRLDALDRRRVGIVGTRNATVAGLATARELGHDLAEAGVTVISGLALGIDGAAHDGVRRAGGPGQPVAVVGSGPDVVYPRRHRDLWRWVVEDGLLMSEWPPGTPPEAWRFPERNRIIAGLCEVLVVVESRERGGSLITARMALDRDVEVMAVPGSPRVRASNGTNKLLIDGAAPVTCVDDVLVALGLDTRRRGRRPFDPRPVPVGDQALVLRACQTEPSTLGTIATATGLELTAAALAAARLERSGWLVEAGGWFEPTRSYFATQTPCSDVEISDGNG